MDGLSPSWGSARTQVVVNGAGFAADPADNRVTFDGVQATVVSASADQLVVEPSQEVSAPRLVAVSVEVARQLSPPVNFTLVPSGFAAPENIALPSSPHGVVQVGADVYVASAQIQGPFGGLYRVEADGRTTRVLESSSLEVVLSPGAAPMRLWDAPIALATDSTDVWFTTAFGNVRRYQLATGAVTEVLSGRGGDRFPGLTGIAYGAGGYLYVVDRNQVADGATGCVLRISPRLQVAAIGDASSALDGAYGIAADGASVFVTNERTGRVVRIASATTAPTVSVFTATPVPGLRGVTVQSGMLVVSDAQGRLLSRSASSAGNLNLLDSVVDRADGLAVSGGDLLLAQSAGHAVRRLPPSGTAQLVTVGLRLTFGAGRSGDALYLASIGPKTLDAGPSATPDAALLQVAGDGAVRLLASGGLFLGAAVLGDGRVAVSDCTANRIFAFDPQSGETTDLVVGPNCPSGLVDGGDGSLFYLYGDPFFGTGSAIGRLDAGGATDPAFVIDLGTVTLLARSDRRLLVAGVGLNGNDPTVWTADAETGGDAGSLVPGAAVANLSALATSPTGEVYVGRVGGQISRLDPATGALTPFATSLVGPLSSPLGSLFFSMAFKDDGTLLLPDVGQGAIVAVAP